MQILARGFDATDVETSMRVRTDTFGESEQSDKNQIWEGQWEIILSACAVVIYGRCGAGKDETFAETLW